MENLHRDWASLVGADKEPERDLIPLHKYKAEMDAYMEEMDSIVQGMKDLTAAEASFRSDMYWSNFKDLVKEHGDTEPCRIGTRIQYNGVTMSCLWFRNRFVPQAESKKRRPLSTHISKGQQNRYNMRAFKKEPEWARELIELTEQEYELLRKRAAIFKQMRSLLAQCRKLTDKSYDLERS